MMTENECLEGVQLRLALSFMGSSFPVRIQKHRFGGFLAITAEHKGHENRTATYNFDLDQANGDSLDLGAQAIVEMLTGQTAATEGK